MPKDYVVSNINDDLQERVQSITQQILSRTRLLQIIEKSNLTVGALTPDEKVAQMRKILFLNSCTTPTEPSRLQPSGSTIRRRILMWPRRLPAN